MILILLFSVLALKGDGMDRRWIEVGRQWTKDCGMLTGCEKLMGRREIRSNTVLIVDDLAEILRSTICISPNSGNCSEKLAVNYMWMMMDHLLLQLHDGFISVVLTAFLELCQVYQILVWIVLCVQVTISFLIHRTWQFSNNRQKRTRRYLNRNQSIKTLQQSIHFIKILKLSQQFIVTEGVMNTICNIADEAIEQSRGNGGKTNVTNSLRIVL